MAMSNNTIVIINGIVYITGSYIGGINHYNGNTSFVEVANSENTKSVTGGQQYFFAIKNDGTLWGGGASDKIGVSGSGFRQVSSATDTKEIACGDYHAYLLKEDGTIWYIGNGGDGRFGNPTGSTSASTFTKNTHVSDVKTVSCGMYNTFILKNDGTLWVCGGINCGLFGSATSYVTSFTQIAGDTSNIREISAGTFGLLALKYDGSVWGAGKGTLFGGATYSSLTQLSNDYDFTRISVGSQHALCLKKDGTVWGIGSNTYGELGLGDTTNRNTLTQIPLPDKAKDISANGGHSVVVLNDGTLLMAGYNFNGQLGDTTKNNRSTFGSGYFANGTVVGNVSSLVGTSPSNNVFYLVYANNKYYSFTWEGDIFEVGSSDLIAGDGFRELDMFHKYLEKTEKEDIPFTSYQLVLNAFASGLYTTSYKDSYMMIPNNTVTAQDVVGIKNPVIEHNSEKYDVFYIYSLDDGITWNTVNSRNKIVSFPEFTMPTSAGSSEWETLKGMIISDGIDSKNTSFHLLDTLRDEVSFKIIMAIKVNKYIMLNERSSKGITSVSVTMETKKD